MSTFIMRFQIADEDAFGNVHTPDEVAEVIEAAAELVRLRAEYPRAIMDLNGNMIGEWMIIP